LLRFCQKLAHSKKLVTAINLPVCLGIFLSGWLATTVPVIAGDLDQTSATIHSDTPPCHATAPLKKRIPVVMKGEFVFSAHPGSCLNLFKTNSGSQKSPLTLHFTVH